MRVRLIGFGAGCLVLLLLVLIDFSRPRELVFDFYQRLLPRQVETSPALVVEIDEISLAEIGPWPWPRSYLAGLTRRLAEAGALAIGFDMIFPEADRYGPARLAELYEEQDPELAARLRDLRDPDEDFRDAISRAPVVLSRAGIAASEQGIAVDPDDLLILAEFSAENPKTVPEFAGVAGNIDRLDGAAAGLAAINGPPDPDGVIRRLPMVVRIGNQLTPALSVELLRVATRTDVISLAGVNSALRAITIADRTVPTEADGGIRPHFSLPYKLRAVSAADVLLGRVPEGLFERKIVIVGLASIGLEDVVATPVISKTYGSDLHAQAIETILAGSWLNRPHDMARIEIVIAMALAALAILVLPAMRASRAVMCFGGMAVLTAGASYAAFAFWRLLIDPVVPLAGGGIPTLVCLAVVLVETDRHRRRLRHSLAEARVWAARIDGELAAAKEIQLGMLPGAEMLAGFPGRVDVQAILEPARGVGGDLYDAFMLDDRRLYFMVGDVTGKGVPASLFMALAKALSKSVVLRDGGDLGSVVMTANEEISRENTAEFFVTALLGILDIETGALDLCNAGHENPLVVGADGSLRTIAMDGGPPLCAFEGFPYPVEPLVLAPGETLVIITDGVTEARAPGGALFGHENLLDCLSRAARRKIIEALVTAVRGFEAGAEATDDLTVLTVCYRGDAANGP